MKKITTMIALIIVAVTLVFVYQSTKPHSNDVTNEVDTNQVEPANNQDATNEPESLTSPDDINLIDLDGKEKDFEFTYHGKTFSAVYSKNSWHITDSYKITNRNDITIICQALNEIHLIPGNDGESYRTAEDMADEWLRHNFAYSFLPEGSQWKASAKDVDLDPEDQGKNLIEMYRQRQH
ncbi:MAG: hypothetical protein IJ629_05100 [Clostridia bacterium]|nr:hypothetical protein [Clostridia bacterium]